MAKLMFVETAHAGGVIDDAPTFADILLNTFDFLLKVAGIIGLIGFVLAGMLYFFAQGDRKRISVAKNIFFACVVGAVILLGAAVLIKAVQGFFS